MNRNRLVALAAAVVVLGVIPVIALGLRVDETRGVAVTPDQAISIVRGFVDQPELTNDLSAAGLRDGAFTRVYEIHGRQIAAFVNANSGIVESLVIAGIVGENSAITVDAEGATKSAEDFLAQRRVPVDGLDRRVRLQNNGDTSEWIVEWTKSVNDVIVPDSREVGIDAASGLVFRYANLSRPYETPGAPKIDRATAEGIATITSGLAKVDESELRIVFTASGVQRLVWTVSLSDSITNTEPGTALQVHAVVEVDAMTGAGEVLTTG